MSVTNVERELVLLSVSDLARVLGTSTRTVWRLLERGKLPKPVRLGSRPRWLADELRDWIKAGMPDAEEWVSPRG
jgi:excisionase family DNA binding protein